MISRIQLGNFKCFESLSLPIAPLTVLCGVNGMGKSSVLQSLLVLRQSFSAGELGEGLLMLSGPLVELGTGVDILFEDATSDTLKFELAAHGLGSAWSLEFDYDRDSDRLTAEPKRAHRPPSYVPMEWRAIPPFGGNVQYVSAERIGPRNLHPRSSSFARRGEIGSRGEYAINLLNERAGSLMEDTDTRVISDESLRFADVIDVWLQHITPGAHLELEQVPRVDTVIAGFNFDRPGDVSTRRFRASNVGFGLSYVLPVLVTLMSPKGTLALIENPEAHLHPRGQTRLGELAARAATAGVQVIVETHSDHFMDGVRIAARNGVISGGDVAFHYFSREEGVANVVSPVLDADGRLSEWPNGFFDQHDENLSSLISPRRRHA